MWPPLLFLFVCRQRVCVCKEEEETGKRKRRKIRRLCIVSSLSIRTKLNCHRRHMQAAAVFFVALFFTVHSVLYSLFSAVACGGTSSHRHFSTSVSTKTTSAAKSAAAAEAKAKLALSHRAAAEKALPVLLFWPQRFLQLLGVVGLLVTTTTTTTTTSDSSKLHLPTYDFSSVRQ